MNPQGRWQWILLASTTIACFAVLAGESLGRYGAQRTLERLSLVWADPMSLGDADREAVVRAALRCRVQLEPAERAAVLACLRRGASQLDDEQRDRQWATTLDHALQLAR